MTKEEIAVLGHAFFDGKTIQFYSREGKEWEDWDRSYCPTFSSDGEWRIKPDEPKTITICTFIDPVDGYIGVAVKDSPSYTELAQLGWTHIKSLDQVVEVE